MPTLGESELKCYTYVLRRTVGFVSKDRASPTGRKTRDRISLSQFSTGIKTGEFVADLGTGLSRTAVRKALGSLQRKGLVQAWWVCSVCDHQMVADIESPQQRCTRCNSRADRYYGASPLGPKMLTRYLNEHDPERRQWIYDKQYKRFKIESAQQVKETQSIMATADSYRTKILHTKTLDRFIQEAEKIRTRPLTPKQLIDEFYKPVIEMQKFSEDHPELVAFALKKTWQKGTIYGEEKLLKKGGTSRSHNPAWHRYAMRIVKNELPKRRREGRRDADGAALAAEGFINHSLAVARRMNREHEQSQDPEVAGAAREQLSLMLARKSELAKLLADDGIQDAKPRANALIRWAFKIGSTDVLSARQQTKATRDYYPEFDWPEDLPDEPLKKKRSEDESNA